MNLPPDPDLSRPTVVADELHEEPPKAPRPPWAAWATTAAVIVLVAAGFFGAKALSNSSSSAWSVRRAADRSRRRRSAKAMPDSVASVVATALPARPSLEADVTRAKLLRPIVVVPVVVVLAGAAVFL